MLVNLKIVWMKASKDEKSFRRLQQMGWEVRKIEDLETTDAMIQGLVRSAI